MLQLTEVTVTTTDGQILVEPISLTLQQGQALTILGETGSGKSLLAQAIMGALPNGLQCQGQMTFDGRPLTDQDKKLLWGKTLAMLAQEPTKSLDPTMTIGDQVLEGFWLVGGLNKKQANDNTIKILEKLGLKNNVNSYPHQLSGGMNQRSAFAVATAGGAKIVIADEPTKGLDAQNRQIIIDLLKQVVQSGGSVLTITHDIFVANELATLENSCLMVMKKGKLLESGHAKTLLNAPKSDYANTLIAASPEHWQGKFNPKVSDELLVSLKNTTLSRGKQVLFKNLSLDIKQGQIIGITGHSGIGKSSFGDMLCGLITPTSGELVWHKKIARQKILKLYQDPPSAFAAHLPLQTLLDDVIKKHGLDKTRIVPLLTQLGLSSELLKRTSSDVSGGELQRIAILRALLFDPVLLFADEVTSRLDPITQQETMDLLVEQCQNIGCTLIMVSHESALVNYYCQTVLNLLDFKD